MTSTHESSGSIFNIEKLNGTNFPFWKSQIMNVLVQKKQVKPIKLKGVKPEAMDQDKIDELTKSTIVLSLDKSVHYNVNENQASYQLWEELCGLFEQKSAASQVYWLKKLVNLRMKEGTSISSHLNEFNSIYGNLVA